jgi:hypothetical protein
VHLSSWSRADRIDPQFLEIKAQLPEPDIAAAHEY